MRGTIALVRGLATCLVALALAPACTSFSYLGERPQLQTPAPRPEPTPRPESLPLPPLELSLDVRASAFNTVPAQTLGQPTITASRARLRPGMQAIAVSPDLLEIGLVYGTLVRIDGYEGEWVVLDRMHDRWTRKIDLYMGKDVDAARRFGVRAVRIRWTPPAAATPDAER
jgi:3D (Asp-Asp-Asp) domain-containing protein